MEHCRDWELSRKRFEALWNREVIDRCCISVTCPQGIIDTSVLTAPTPEDFWTHKEILLKRHSEICRKTSYHGDAFPCVFLNFGPGGNAAYYGATPVFRQESIWYDRCLFSEEDYLTLSFCDPFNMYEKTLEVARFLQTSGEGEFLISMPDNFVALDVLALLRGNEDLLVDMIGSPENIDAALAFLAKEYPRYTQTFYEIVKDSYGGSSIGWLNTYAPGLHAQIQCDIASMISTEAFNRFFLPELYAATEFLEYPLYHLDGMEQIRHLDSLLACEQLRMIQWTSVAGQPPAIEFLDTLKQIQQAHKGLLLNVEPQYVEDLVRGLSSRGLYIVTYAQNQQEAEELVSLVSRLTHD